MCLVLSCLAFVLSCVVLFCLFYFLITRIVNISHLPSPEMLEKTAESEAHALDGDESSGDDIDNQ